MTWVKREDLIMPILDLAGVVSIRLVLTYVETFRWNVSTRVLGSQIFLTEPYWEWCQLKSWTV
ncbi:hypothetical protein OGM63_14715 [Plectonema radiosum NIES-515]|uniref:Uncharacterized protein n=1 Tax=Plectonema radiosum NIES-515 TaxID=2986073 RepID=A0ABT3B050_9CYAN|nr:hypothetical protein [Plectonema radiosum]MCV3214754.1 hypothetical protein [Plectonema radiosum NIES-515]